MASSKLNILQCQMEPDFDANLGSKWNEPDLPQKVLVWPWTSARLRRIKVKKACIYALDNY